MSLVDLYELSSSEEEEKENLGRKELLAQPKSAYCHSLPPAPRSLHVSARPGAFRIASSTVDLFRKPLDRSLDPHQDGGRQSFKLLRGECGEVKGGSWRGSGIGREFRVSSLFL